MRLRTEYSEQVHDLSEIEPTFPGLVLGDERLRPAERLSDLALSPARGSTQISGLSADHGELR